MLIAQSSLLQNELLVVQDLLRVTVLNLYPERLSGSVVALIPDEGWVGSKVQLNTDQSPRDGLHVGFKLEAWELVDLIQDILAHLWEVHDLAYLLSIHVVEVVPLKLRLFLDLSRNVIEVHHLSELA